jgi:hypothetical protein
VCKPLLLDLVRLVQYFVDFIRRRRMSARRTQPEEVRIFNGVRAGVAVSIDTPVEAD